MAADNPLRQQEIREGGIMAGGVSNTQVLTEIKELRTDIHNIDKKQEVLIEQGNKRGESIIKLMGEVYNGGGIRERLHTVEECIKFELTKEEKKDKFSLDVKSSIIAGSFMLLISTLAQLLVTKVF